MDSQCKELNRSGGLCGAQHYKDGLCRWHHPELAAQRQAERAAGGKARSNRSRARKDVLAAGMELSEVDAAMCKALVDVLSGSLEPNIGTAAATIARTVSAIRTATDLERRIESLEQQAVTTRRFS